MALILGRTRSGQLGVVADEFGTIWTSLRRIWTIWGGFGTIWDNLDEFGTIWTSWDEFGTNLDDLWRI